MLEACREDLLMIYFIHKMIHNLSVILQPTVDEANYSIGEWSGDNKKEWRFFGTKETIVDSIARVTTRVFVGNDFARNEVRTCLRV